MCNPMIELGVIVGERTKVAIFNDIADGGTSKFRGLELIDLDFAGSRDIVTTVDASFVAGTLHVVTIFA